MRIDELLSSAPDTPIEDLPERAVDLAALLLAEALEQRTHDDRHSAERMAAMMRDPDGKRVTVELFDQVFRSNDAARVADQLDHLIGTEGVPHYFAGWERVAMGTGAIAGRFLPKVVVPAVVARVRAETAAMILPSEERQLSDHLARRRDDGVRMNINYLGEAILGEEEAAKRLEKYLDLLRRDDIDYVSVKTSSIYSQIDHVAADATKVVLKDRLRSLYRAAADAETPKFVNLDMEAYGDLHLTFDAFTETLGEEEFHDLPAGIVLQAYLPDAGPLQRALTIWARERVDGGGAPIKLRIVKGANLAMEQVDASWYGWEQAPYGSKAEVDANFTAMVRFGTQREHAEAVRLGIGSHNLFDVSHTLLLRAHHRTEAFVDIEMLEGMANHQAKAVQDVAGSILLYAPIVEEKDFRSAIAYLIRRLDENTEEENFLHDLFGMVPGDPAFAGQADRFLAASLLTAAEGPRRSQDRATDEVAFDPTAPFTNAPDTDFSLPANQAWATAILDTWQSMEVPRVLPIIDGAAVSSGRVVAKADPSDPDAVAYEWEQADAEQVASAIATAVEASPSWAAMATDERAAVLEVCAEELERRRGDLLGAMALDAAKTLAEADVEVSEAVDFARFYARSLTAIEADGAVPVPLGVVTVAPPWNFPLAIPAGGVLAALAAGNTVLCKPAPETVLVAARIVEALHDAGVPTDVLQFVPTSDDEVGQRLITDERIASVVLTGAWETGQLFLGWRPDLRLSAETSGKNALIVTAMSDRDQAIKDLVRSAFGHSGQKCSAASLGILEAEVYDDAAFLRQLADAVQSLHVGGAWDTTSKVVPVIREPGSALTRGLTQLEQGEEWLVEPRHLGGTLWSPGVRLGVQPGSFLHTTECFGPVMGLMRAPDLDTAIGWMNDTDYALTSGIHSLDEREIKRWCDTIEAGNGYVNRHITGAIVQRQPFGGWKRSSYGPGAKAGGPNYVSTFAVWEEELLPEQVSTPAPAAQRILDQLPTPSARVIAAAGSYARAWHQHFSPVHDPSMVVGEVNGFRYRTAPRVLIRLRADGDPEDALLAVLAARTAGVPLGVSLEPGAEWEWHGLPTHVVVEDDATFAGRLTLDDRVRVIGTPPRILWEHAREAHARVFTDPVVAQGRIELRWYLREQAMSIRTHRYGNLVGLGEEALLP
ncbi:MAG: bifunctional proline dehydrogenase/L-glutamate gamma-semialdehyde dehydrogenase [Acidimicrobiia bacterium]|nr:bifunctional proline dehydrogenase/L-glutamate gamma-semialdehyde dehydrogenase [Acidimicrobiia bacterium]